MQFEKELDSAIQAIAKSEYANASSINRIKAEIDFSVGLISLYPDKADEWKPLILKAAQLVRDKTTKSDSIDLASVVAEAESILMPIGKVAKEFTIHCCGHAHIDMNWCWPWPETVSVTHDTFATVDKLMNEFPDFIFSQSQASVYFAMEEYCPEILEIIKKRIKEGRWESTASMWVEGDKNLASGEILCRHMLYTRQYMKEKFGIPTDAVKIDWECDTFGHAHTIPSILVRGGVTRYYHCRTGPNKWLVWWEAPDKSRVLLFLDKAWYLGPVNTDIINYLIDYVKETGLKDFLWVYGVGDHGGGPTRKDLVRTQEMNSWPIWPNLRFSTTDKYFTAVEKSNPDLPVHNGELNFVFDGCYTSESNIKLANRVCESILPEAEVASLVAGAVSRFTYPADEIRKGWRHAMFNQFHDILPGSGIHATYEYSQGLFQEVQAITGIIRTRALRQIASKIDTSAALGVDPPVGKGADVISNGIGAGAGDLTLKTGVSAYSVGSVGVEPIVIFNGLPFPRTSMVETKIWDRDIPDNRIIVRDETGNTVAAQVLARGNYGGHKYTRLVFPALDVPAIGYKVFGIDRSPVNAISAIPESFGGAPGGGTLMRETVPIEHPDEVEMPLPGVLENRFIRVEVDPASGAIKHLIDKKSGYDYVPTGNLLGVLELYREAHNDMSAWTIGQIMNVDVLSSGGTLSEIYHGPHRATVKTTRKVNNSNIAVEISLDAGSNAVQFKVIMDWREWGTKETGVPMLKVAFPTALTDTSAKYEIPFGSIERPVNGQEVPALRWADISGSKIGSEGQAGLILVNDCKYGHSADDNTLRLTLVRSSYSPDPLPEMGKQEIRFAVIPHEGPCPVSDATRYAAMFNQPMSVVSTDVHKGSEPSSQSFAEVLTPNIMLAGIKKAEDSDAVIIRLYEMEGKDTEARVRLNRIVKPGSTAVEVNLMEEPLANTQARMENDTLVVNIPARGISTVAIS